MSVGKIIRHTQSVQRGSNRSQSKTNDTTGLHHLGKKSVFQVHGACSKRQWPNDTTEFVPVCTDKSPHAVGLKWQWQNQVHRSMSVRLISAARRSKHTKLETNVFFVFFFFFFFWPNDKRQCANYRWISSLSGEQTYKHCTENEKKWEQNINKWKKLLSVVKSSLGMAVGRFAARSQFTKPTTDRTQSIQHCSRVPVCKTFYSPQAVSLKKQ